MKLILLIAFSVFFYSCTSPEQKQQIPHISKIDTVFKRDTIYIDNSRDWQNGFGLTHDPDEDSIWGHPVNFYIKNPKCSPIAIDFYLGVFRPSDNNATSALLALITTDDKTLRPYYRWCLNKTIQIQDGALAEYTGIPARQYAEKFPKEFFEYMDEDPKGDRYRDWVESISYSGFYDYDDYKKSVEIAKRMTAKMKSSCLNCNNETLKRIDKLAIDCFP